MKPIQFLALVLLTILSPFAAAADGASRCFELRIYHVAEGKLDALNSRFRDHTTALFTRHPGRVLNLLKAGQAETSGPETLALLALACDPSGLNRPEESQQWAELARREYPASVFTRVVWLDRCRRAAWERVASRTAGESTPSALLRDYDASADGTLDLVELNLGVNCEPLRFRSGNTMTPSPQMLPTLLARFDRDQRPGLSAEELELMLAKPAPRTNAPGALARPPSSRQP